METVTVYFLGLQNHCRWWLQPWNKKTLAPWKKSCYQTRQHIKKQRYYLTNKGPYSQSYGFSSSHVWMWELEYKKSWALKNWCFRTVVLEKTLESPLDYKESWVPKNWCFWTVVLEKTFKSPLDSKEIKPVNPKEISPEYSLEGLMVELKLQYSGQLMQRTDSWKSP